MTDITRIELNNEIRRFLENAGLPVADLERPVGVELFGRYAGDRIAGVVGMEVHGNIGLLRSLAVELAFRNTGCGKELVAYAERWAVENAIESLYLLTTTADAFFARLGYRMIPRSRTPHVVAGSTQFADLCPATATLMYKNLAL